MISFWQEIVGLEAFFVSSNVFLIKNGLDKLIIHDVLPHMWTLDQGQTQQGDWTLSTC
jgi:hypothetical protein